MVREFIEIPHGAHCELSISEDVHRVFRLSQLGISGRIAPLQAPVPKIAGARDSAPFLFDAAAYRTNNFLLKSAARLTEVGIVRNRRLALLEVFPVNYNPRAGTLKILTSVRITISLSGSDDRKNGNRASLLHSPRFDNLAHHVVLNAAVPATIPADQGSKSGRGVGYLVIAAPAFAGSASLQDLIDLRTIQGFDVTLVDTNATGSSTTGIKNYIENAYNTQGIEYVLLVGDTDTIPNWTGGGSDSPATDLNYACVDGTDYLPDLFRGRFPVRTAADLDNLCSKIIAAAGNSLKDAVFMASNDNWRITEGTHDTVIGSYLQPDGWISDKLYSHTHSATTSQVTNAFNSGRTIGCYSGHGSETSWADGPRFTQSNVRSLTNDYYPFVMSFACVTGKYSRGECFAETWVRDKHGATGFIGSSVNSFWNEDDILERKIFKGWYDLGLDRIGQMVDYGQYELYLKMGAGADTRRYYEMYNLMGDPAMRVRGGSGGGLFTLAVSPDPLQGGQNAVFSVNGGDPLTNTYLAYSLNGPGSVPVSALNVTLDLAGPVRAAGPTQTDAQGSVTWTLAIPAVAPGLNVWFQSVQYGRTTNVAATTIQ